MNLYNSAIEADPFSCIYPIYQEKLKHFHLTSNNVWSHLLKAFSWFLSPQIAHKCLLSPMLSSHHTVDIKFRWDGDHVARGELRLLVVIMWCPNFSYRVIFTFSFKKLTNWSMLISLAFPCVLNKYF